MANANILYIDCKNSGISGDLFLSAISSIARDDELFERLISIIKKLYNDVEFLKSEFEKIEKNGVFPRRLLLKLKEPSHSKNIKQIKSIILQISSFLNLSEEATNFSLDFLNTITEAEGSVHHTASENVHLHEIGSVDTVIDICGISAYLDKLGIFKMIKEGIFNIICSPIPVGGGKIKISHGTVAIPAPATTKILQQYNIPFFGGPIHRELCTPTGAALIASLIKLCKLQFSEFIPKLTLLNNSESTGTLETDEFPNILRLFLGISDEIMADEEVSVIETTVDDISGELIGHMMDQLLNNGALDVNFIPVQAKKNRPAILIKIITPPSNINTISQLLIKKLGTLGVRYRLEKRKCVFRQILIEKSRSFGKEVTYRVKIAKLNEKSEEFFSFKIEFDDLARISSETGRSIHEIKNILNLEFVNTHKKNKSTIQF